MYSDWKGDVKCFTCPEVRNYKEVHAGHFHHNYLDFSDLNIHPQCPRCNKYLSGNLGVYALGLTRKYGSKILETLEAEKNKEKQRIDTLGYRYTEEELTEIINDRKEKIEQLNRRN